MKNLSENLELLSDFFKQRNKINDEVNTFYEIANSYSRSFKILPQLMENTVYPFIIIAGLIRTNSFIDMAKRNPESLKKESEWSRLESIVKNTLLALKNPENIEIDVLDKKTQSNLCNIILRDLKTLSLSYKEQSEFFEDFVDIPAEVYWDSIFAFELTNLLRLNNICNL